MHKVLTGLRHPREALLYLLAGKDRYNAMQVGPTGHTCLQARDIDLPFLSLMTNNTDIHEHLNTLYMLTVQLRLRNIVELGVRGGESTIALLWAARKIDGKVNSFDIDTCPVAKARVEQYGLERFWSFTQADDLAVDWEAPIDHLFIDTSHTFHQTTKELEKYEPHVRPGGVVTMHDSISYPELKRATRAYFNGRKDVTSYEYVNNNGLLVIFKGEHIFS